MPRPFPLLVLVALLVSRPAHGAEADSVHARIERVLAAYGGRTALQSVHAYRLEGETFSAMRHTTAPIVRLFARPDRFKTLIDYEKGPEARVVNGARGWRNSPGDTLEPVAGPMLDAMRLQVARAALPWILAERESAAVVIPPLEHEGVKLDGLEIALAPGLVLRVYVDPQTGLIARSQGELARGTMRTRFETYYSDFRDVRGLRFAFHEDNWASGVQTGVTTVKRVLLDPKLSPDEFQPPVVAAPPVPRGD